MCNCRAVRIGRHWRDVRNSGIVEVDYEVEMALRVSMSEIDVSGNRLLRQVFERGMEAAYPMFLSRLIRGIIHRNGLRFEEDRLKALEDGGLEELVSFANGLVDAADKQGFLGDMMKVG